MRLANEIAARRDGARPGAHPARDDARARSARCGTAGCTTTAPATTGKVELAHGFSLVWSGPGIRTFTATGSRPIHEHEPTLFEIWVCADGYWCDHTKNLVPGELDAALRRARAAVAVDVHAASRSSLPAGASLAELDRRSAHGLAEMGYPGPAEPSDLPRSRRPRPRAALRAPGRRRHDRGGDGARDRAGRLLAGGRRAARRGQLPDHRGGAERLCRFPDGIVRAA